jgi:hypothetical protein
MVRNVPKHEFWVQCSGSVAFIVKNLTQLRLAKLCVNAAVRPIVHRLSCSNETVRNIPKHEF